MNRRSFLSLAPPSFGLPANQAEDALHSERAARHVLSRRSFFGVSAAMAAGTAFGFLRPPRYPKISGKQYDWSNVEIALNGEAVIGDIVEIQFAPNAVPAWWPRNFVRRAGTTTYAAVVNLEQSS